MWPAFRARVLLAYFFLASSCSAFYIPGFSIRSYKENDPIPLATNKLTSPITQLPFAYSEQPFVCSAKRDGFGAKFGSSRAIGMNLGEVLRGDRIEISDYELVMGQDVQCKHLCDREVDRSGVEKAKQLVRGGYVVEWIVDNLPGATSFVTVDKTRKYYAAGFKLGFYENDKAYINNHVTLVIRWRGIKERPGRRVIVAFEVFTKSIVGPEGACPATLDNQHPLKLYIEVDRDDEGRPINEDDGKTMKIPYTYSVYWKEDSTIEWSNRWDLYFINDEESASVHWLAIINSIVITMLLTIMVAIVMLRTLSRDIQNYNETGPSLDPEGKTKAAVDGDGDDQLDDVTGWKLLHGDVFRPPRMGSILAPLVGSGVQLMAVSASLLVLACVGVLNPSYRGGFISFGLFLFVFAGVFSGFFSIRVYKTFKGDDWKKNALLTALIFPGFCFSVVFTMNLFVWAQASSTAIPFTTLLALLFMWLGISLPLVFLGSFFGFKRAPWEHPTRTNMIARQIPSQPWFLRPASSILLGGLIPFFVIFIELLFVFKSLWQDKSSYYYMYGFLGVSVGLLLLVIIEITICFTYFQLCAENYNWWWQSFGIGAGASVWVFIYSIYYFWHSLQVQGFVSGLLFFAYSGLACTVMGVLTGTIGFMAAYTFVRRIYSAIKAD